ncbi:MAG TPA: hypothetical protein VGX03_00235, partial [Candidatus Binatia bacterium]|nr:hypothetical protein [Candidatus Binatia bacterium]
SKVPTPLIVRFPFWVDPLFLPGGLFEFGRDGGAAGVIADRQPDGKRVCQACQVRTLALRLEFEGPAPQGPDRGCHQAGRTA